MTAPRANLDKAFPYDVDEMIERALLAYRPVLSHRVMAAFRDNLDISINGRNTLDPWLNELAAGDDRTRVQGTDKLSAGQVALLGGTRPTRIVHSVVSQLRVRLDCGASESDRTVSDILLKPFGAVWSLAKQHAVTPVRGRDAAARKLGEFVELGIAAQYAGMIGALYEYGVMPGRLPADEESAFFATHFVWALQAFARVELSRGDQAVFRDYYVEQAKVREIAEERGRTRRQEIERRRAFLKRLGTALKAEIDAVAREVSADPAGANLGPLPWAPPLPAGAARPGRLLPKKR